MNIYKALAITVLFVFMVHLLDVGPSVQQFFQRMADIPQFQGSRSPAFELGIRMAYLIAIVGIVKVIFSRSRNDE